MPPDTTFSTLLHGQPSTRLNQLTASLAGCMARSPSRSGSEGRLTTFGVCFLLHHDLPRSHMDAVLVAEAAAGIDLQRVLPCGQCGLQVRLDVLQVREVDDALRLHALRVHERHILVVLRRVERKLGTGDGEHVRARDDVIDHRGLDPSVLFTGTIAASSVLNGSTATALTAR